MKSKSVQREALRQARVKGCGAPVGNGWCGGEVFAVILGTKGKWFQAICEEHIGLLEGYPYRAITVVRG